MRSKSHIKIITAQIENLEEIKMQFQAILKYINKVIEAGHSWIEEKENKFSFLQMNQFMTNETFKCIQKCEEISSTNREISGLSKSHSQDTNCACSLEASILDEKEETKNYKAIQSSLDEIFKINLLQEKKINKLNKKVRKQDSSLGTIKTQIGQIDKRTTLKLEDIETELISASDFMSQLQTQNECLESELKDKEKIIIEIQQQFKAQSDQQELNGKFVNEMKSQFSLDLSHLNGEVEMVWNKLENVQMDTLSQLSRSMHVGFHAFCGSDLESRSYFQLNEILTCFKDIRKDYQNNFDHNTGIFTAPRDGLYMFHLKVEMYENQDMFIGFTICLKRQIDKTETKLNNVYCQTMEVPGQVVGFTEMVNGDQIYIKCHLECFGAVLSRLSEFMCVLLA